MATTVVVDGFPIASAGDVKATLIAGQDGTNAQAILTDTTGRPLVVVDATTPSSASTAASSVYSPVTSVVTAAVLKATAGNVFKFFATNTNAAVRYMQLHNKATIPLATEVPVVSLIIPAGTATAPGYIEYEFKYGKAFATGIGFAISTTQGTFTDSATASEHTKIVEYV